MLYKIEELRSKCFGKVLEVYEVFKDFFGEERVDLHGANNHLIVDYIRVNKLASDTEEGWELTDYSIGCLIRYCNSLIFEIYVYWPYVTVTNENDKSIGIKDLYAQIKINGFGEIPFESTGFYLNRATYSKTQFFGDYMHSHIQRIPTNNFMQFMTPCLGNGPIRETIHSLQVSNDSILWMLFCEELARFVTVESLSGGPWKRLESISTGREYTEFNSYAYVDLIGYNYTAFNNKKRDELVNEFLPYYLEHGHLTFNYNNGFVCGMPPQDYIIDVSNAFIDFFNERYRTNNDYRINRLFESGFLIKAVYSGGKFFKPNSLNRGNDSISSYVGNFVLTFKGRDITLSIEEDHAEDADIHETTLVSSNVCMYMLTCILKLLNYYYKNEHTDEQSGTSATYQEIKFV